MSYESALAEARVLKTSLLDHGVKRVSIELVPGRPIGGGDRVWHASRDFFVECSHHTVSRPSQGLTPVLALCKTGRPGVPGPLCNGYMGFDHTYRILCMAWANHPGAGGPLTVGGRVIPRDQARPYLWGTEFEGGIIDWTDGMHEAMARACAGILDWLGVGVENHVEHKTWAPDRKVDRLGYTAESARRLIARYAEPKMPTTPVVATRRKVPDVILVETPVRWLLVGDSGWRPVRNRVERMAYVRAGVPAIKVSAEEEQIMLDKLPMLLRAGA